MVHYVMIKFQEGYLGEERIAMIRDTYTEMLEAIDGILGVEIHENIIERDSNADLMIRIELEGAAALDTYLNHPLHVAFAREARPNIVKMVTFDR